MSANDRQVGGDWYKTMTIEPWDFIEGNGLGYAAGNVIKYVCRADKKGGIEDLRKAAHYLEKMIEMAVERQKWPYDTATAPTTPVAAGTGAPTTPVAAGTGAPTTPVAAGTGVPRAR